MKSKKLVIWVLLVLLALTVWGCGSSRDSSGTATGGANDGLANAAALGIVNCTTCHAYSSLPVDDWYNGVHGNSNNSPSYPLSSCASRCHDALGDGMVLDSIDINSGWVNRPIVSCESCHGGGQYHLGNPAGVPYAKPGPEQCAGCHEGRHGLAVATDYDENLHETSLNSSVYDSANPELARAKCSKCHTSEGGRLYKTVAGDKDQLAVLDAEPGLQDTTSVSCRTCHTPHQEEVLLLGTDAVVAGSAQYNTCGNCHQLTYPILDNSGSPEPMAGEWMKDAYHGGLTGRFDRIISDTHFDDPVTGGIEGYVVIADSDDACAACHNPHATAQEINQQWSRSRHAGSIAQAKADAEAAAGNVFTATATTSAWMKTSTSCLLCHTASGVASYLNDPVAFDPTTVTFSHISGNQNEMLYCWGCHDSYTPASAISGTPTAANDVDLQNINFADLRNPGALELFDRNSVSMGVLPDLGSSNVCVTCHGGRGNQTTMITNVNAGTVHYLAATGTLFNNIVHTGYEYAGLDYASGYFVHDTIRLNLDVPESGSGPCAGCHMDSAEGHVFAVVTKDASSQIVDITSNDLCMECHSSSSMNVAILQNLSDGFQDALAILSLNLPGTPAGNDQLGATHNYNYLSTEYGAYAHKSRYARRLIFDSIDFLDGGISGTITIDADTYPKAAEWYGAPAGTSGSYIASRP